MSRVCLGLLAIGVGIATLANSAPAQPKGKNEPKAVALSKELKAALMKRVTLENDLSTVPLAELLAHLAKKGGVKIEIDDKAFRAEGVANIAEQKPGRVSGKDIRLDLLLSAVMEEVGAQPEIRKDVIVLVPRGTGKQFTTLRQPPDATHTAAVAAAKKSLATKVEIAALEIPLAEFLQNATAKYKLAFVINESAFRAAGVNAVTDQKVKVKAAKGAALESVLRDGLKTIDAELVLDPYGQLTINPKPSGANM